MSNPQARVASFDPGHHNHGDGDRHVSHVVEVMIMKTLIITLALCFLPALGLAQPVVSLTTPDPDAAEVDLDPATFRFSRTGGNINLSLRVYVDVGGTAVSGADYIQVGLSPTSPLSVVIPADDAFFDVVITPLMDVLEEGGAETVEFSLRDDVAYDVDPGSTGPIAITIADDPPIASLAVLDDSAAEVGQDPATFRFSRTGGNINEVLRVFVDVGGTAVGGADYDQVGLSATTPPSIVFPAGDAFFDVVITPRMDVLMEGPETVVMSLRDDVGTYDVDPGSTGPMSITIADDVPIASLAVLDDAAAEAGQDPATFRLSRTGGDINQSLRVNVDVGGTANSGDYDQVGLSPTNPRSVVIPADDTFFDVVITPRPDSDETEGEETVIITLRNDSGSYTVNALADTGTITIADFVDEVFTSGFEATVVNKACNLSKALDTAPQRFFDLGYTALDLEAGLQWSRCNIFSRFDWLKLSCGTEYDQAPGMGDLESALERFNLGLSGDNSGFADWRMPTNAESRALPGGGCDGLVVREL